MYLPVNAGIEQEGKISCPIVLCEERSNRI